MEDGSGQVRRLVKLQRQAFILIDIVLTLELPLVSVDSREPTGKGTHRRRGSSRSHDPTQPTHPSRVLPLRFPSPGSPISE